MEALILGWYVLAIAAIAQAVLGAAEGGRGVHPPAAARDQRAVR